MVLAKAKENPLTEQPPRGGFLIFQRKNTQKACVD